MRSNIFCTLLYASLLLVTLEAKGQSDERFYFPDKEWLGLDGYDYEEIVMEDGEDAIHSVLFKPFDGNRPVGTVMFFHGNGSNISKWIGYMRPLLEADYQVVIMDYRGYGLSTGAPTHLNIATDARRLTDLILEREDIRDLPLVIYGASIGTQVATLITAENDDRVALLVLDSAMKSFTDIALITSPPEYHDMIRQYVVSPYSAIDRIGDITHAKVLIIHSETDWVPIQGARELYEKAVAEKSFWQYEGDHVTAARLYPSELVARINKVLGL